MDKLILVGVDPGTTAGYAAFDLNGNLVKAKSSKNLDLKIMISELVSLGRPVIIATDKKVCPAFVVKLAAALGAKIVSPQSDMLVKEKLEFAAGFQYDNSHELDAIASARYAYKITADLLKRIEKALDKENKKELENKVKLNVLLKKSANIKSAIKSAEFKPEPKEIVRPQSPVVKPKNQLPEPEINIDEIFSLKAKNKRIKQELKKAIKKIRQLGKQLTRPKTKEEIIAIKDNSIAQLRQENEGLKSAIDELKKELIEQKKLFSEAGKSVVLKRLDNLGWDELIKKSTILNIQQGDILLVDDLNIYSEKTLDFLKDKIDIIAFSKPISRKLEKQLKFTLLDSKKLNIKSNKHFALVDKNEFKKAYGKSGILDRIVSSYKEERAIYK